MRSALHFFQDLIDVPLMWLNEKFLWLTKAFYVSFGLEDLADELDKVWDQVKRNIKQKKSERKG